MPFVQTFAMLGVDLTGATFAAQVRLTPDATGAPLVSLATVGTSLAEGVHLFYGGTSTIAAHITAGRLSSIPNGSLGTDSLALSIVGLRINESTMEALPYPGERGNDAPLAWDIHITPAGGTKQKWLGGAFTVEAGVTQ